MDQYSHLKKLLLQPEQEQIQKLEAELARLREQLADKERLLETIKPVISETLSQKIRESRDEVAAALAPVMGAAIKKQIQEARDEVVDALYPVIGQTIRKSIAEAMKKLVASINERLEQSLGLRNIYLRLKARITGVPYEQLVLMRALPFRILHVYVIQKESGVLIHHATAPGVDVVPDKEMITGMLTAIRQFASEAFSQDQTRELNKISYEDVEIYLENSRYVYLAFVIEGVPPANFEEAVHVLENELHRQFHAYFRSFSGEEVPLPELDTRLRAFMDQFQGDVSAVRGKKTPSMRRVMAVAAVLIGIVIGSLVVPDIWRDFRLSREIEKLRLNGQLALPPSVELAVNDGQLMLSGTLNAWNTRNDVLKRVRRLFPNVPVVDRLTVKPFSTQLQQWQTQVQDSLKKLGLPEVPALRLSVVDGAVVVEGPAKNKLEAMKIASLVGKITHAPIIVNVMQEAAIPAEISWINRQKVYFAFGSTTLSDSARQVLREIARRLQPLSFEELVIYGFADSLGTPAQNRRMARKRAESVRNFLQQLGIPANKMRIDVQNPVDRQVTNIAEARRVEFRVMP